MNILVCIKPVPDPEEYSSLEIDRKTKTLNRKGVPTVINPPDKNALEEAIRLRDTHGGRITVLSMAPEFSRDKIVEGLAMGADEAFLVSDRAFGGADTYATAYVLAEAVKKIALQANFDLILMGNESADGATAHVPAQLAEWLGLPHICNVKKIEITEPGGSSLEGSAEVKVWKKTEGGADIFAGKLPALVAVSRDINKPRLINAMGIIKARKKPLTVLNNTDLKLKEEKTGLKGSPTQMGEMIVPDLSRHAEDMGTDAAEVADKILMIIEKAGV